MAHSITLTLFRNALSWALLTTGTLLPATSLYAEGSKKYHLTFHDEFNSPFDKNRWMSTDFHGIRNNSGDYQAQWFSDPASAPSGSTAYNPFIPGENGTLSIQADRTPAGAFSQGLPYVSGMMSTAHKFTQRYGYYELRAKIPAGPGLWSRFWLLTDNGAWPGEYDVFEILGRDNSPDPKNYFTYQVRQTTHFWDTLTAHGIDGTQYRGINPFDGKFHNYGFLWEPESVTWYVDGVATAKQANRINIPMYVILDLAVGTDANWPGKVDATTPFPAKLEMDYFRIYSNDPSIPSVEPEKGYAPSSTIPPEVVLDSAPIPSQLPEGWTAGDVGKPDAKGSTSWNPVTGEWMLRGAGNTISTSGQCQFAHSSLPGDGAVIASVLNVTEIASNEVRAGVTIRANTNPGSAEVSLYYKAAIPWPSMEYTTSITLQSRDTDGGKIEETVVVPSVAKASITSPVTLGLVRRGNMVTAAYSTDGGSKWTPVGDAKPIAMSGPLLAGIALGGNQSNYLKPARGTFDNVTVGGLVPNLNCPATHVITGEKINFSASLTHAISGEKVKLDPVSWSVASGGGTISDSGVYTAPNLTGKGLATVKAVVNGLSVTRNIAVILPSPWTMPSLTQTPPGDAGFSSGRWTVVGGGVGISTTGGQDAFRFVSSLIMGNETITVRVDSAPGSQAGLMIRDFTSIGDNTAGRSARYATILRTPTGLQWATREKVGDKAVLGAEASTPPGPIWLRLVRSGASSDVFSAFYSQDGSAWTQLGSSRTFTLTDPAFAGLAVATGSLGKTESFTFSSLTVASRRSTSPTLVIPATCPAKAGASPSIITGKKANVAVLAADNGGESALTYTWSATGPGNISFATNETNAAKMTTATFAQSGSYVLTVTITDEEKLATVSSVSVRVK